MTFWFRASNSTDAAESVERAVGSDFYVDEAIYTVVSVSRPYPSAPGHRSSCCGRRARVAAVAQPGVWEAVVERTEGKFHSRDDVWNKLEEQLGLEVEEVGRPQDSEACAVCGRLARPTKVERATAGDFQDFEMSKKRPDGAPAADMAELFPRLPAAVQEAYVQLVRWELAGSRPNLGDLLDAHQRRRR